MDYSVLCELSLFGGDSAFMLNPLPDDFTEASLVTEQSQYDAVSDKSELQKLLEGSSTYTATGSQESPPLSPQPPSTPEVDWLNNEVNLRDLLPDFGSFSELACDSLDASDMFTALTPLEHAFTADDILHSAVKEGDLLEYDDSEQLVDVDLLLDLPSLSVDTGAVDIEPVLSPVSIEDVECLLSSGPSSPSGSLSADSDSSFSVASSDASEVKSCGGSVRRPRDREAACPYKPGRESRILDKKLRKKQQNKDAALRYRLKKKAESQTMETDLQGLEGRNKQLKDSVDQMTREIQYLKDLMAEVYKAELSKSSRSIVS